MDDEQQGVATSRSNNTTKEKKKSNQNLQTTNLGQQNKKPNRTKNNIKHKPLFFLNKSKRNKMLENRKKHKDLKFGCLSMNTKQRGEGSLDSFYN
jgi:hypothetical protein